MGLPFCAVVKEVLGFDCTIHCSKMGEKNLDCAILVAPRFFLQCFEVGVVDRRKKFAFEGASSRVVCFPGCELQFVGFVKHVHRFVGDGWFVIQDGWFGRDEKWCGSEGIVVVFFLCQDNAGVAKEAVAAITVHAAGIG